MPVQEAVDRTVRERPDLAFAAAAGRPKAWGALAAHGVLTFRTIAGRPPTDLERRAIWSGLWAAAVRMRHGPTEGPAPDR